MTDSSFYNRHFDSIQALRGIAAVFIILEHIRFLNCGAFGVDIFFAISGFMAMYTTHQGREQFFRKRLIRILPLYYLMTLGTYLLLLLFPQMFQQTWADPAYLIKSLLFLPFDIGGGVLQPLMRIGWTVNCEMFFYLVFFLAMVINHRFRGPLTAAMLLLVVGAANALPVSWAPLSFYGNPVMLEFIWGILCFYLAKLLYERRHGLLSKPAAGAAAYFTGAGIFALLLFTKPTVNVLGFRRPFLWGIPGALLFLCAFTAGLPSLAASEASRAGSIPGQASSTDDARPGKRPSLPCRLAVRLGNISYSVYLIHYYPVMLLDRAVFDFSEGTPLALLGVPVCLGVSVLSAALSWFLVEQKLGGWLRRKLL